MRIIGGHGHTLTVGREPRILQTGFTDPANRLATRIEPNQPRSQIGGRLEHQLPSGGGGESRSPKGGIRLDFLSRNRHGRAGNYPPLGIKWLRHQVAIVKVEQVPGRVLRVAREILRY